MCGAVVTCPTGATFILIGVRSAAVDYLETARAPPEAEDAVPVSTAAH